MEQLLHYVWKHKMFPLEPLRTTDGQLVEGKGITPDIDVALDLPLLQTTGRDTQIDRALQFIRTGK